MIQLRDYQMTAVEQVKHAYLNGHTAPVLVLPTGGGKTVVFAFIAFSSASRGKRVLILVHRIELLRQTQNKLAAFGIRAGLISPKYTPDYNAPVQVAMIQTLQKRLDKYPKFDLVVTDECHHVGADTYNQVLSFYNCFQLGVTATPIRSDGKGLGKGHGGVYDTMILGPSTRQLMDMGFLVQPDIYLPPCEIDRKGIKRSMGDFNKKEAAARVDKRNITGNAVDHYESVAKHDPGIAFCVNVEHARNVAEEFRARGYRAYCVDGGMDERERSRIVNGLADGSVQIATSCDVFSEGFDSPNIACGISLRPTQSKGLHLQQIGRVLRPAPNKPRASWLDHVGNCASYVRGQLTIEHGFPDDDHQWTLEGLAKAKEEKEKAERITLCESCYMAYKPTMSVCPHCGSARAVKPVRKIEQKDGELIKLDKAHAMAIQKQKRMEVGAARTIEELERIAQEREYKPGWIKKQAELKGIA
jgi:superfamily II DNA or RNA helicase